jgi:hypothetical protein
MLVHVKKNLCIEYLYTSIYKSLSFNYVKIKKKKIEKNS